MFKNMFPVVLMRISLIERALMMKLFYENKGYAFAAVCEIRRRKNLLRVPMSAKGIQSMIKRFEEMRKLGVKPGRGRKRVTPVLVEGVKTAIDVQSQVSEFGGCKARTVSRQTVLFL
ncbi:hypothetical protein TNCT_525251 [Trichonephila clavata]|uniref:DUF4817 domain-containing protein n=1 Tax=Trichonephila clavata TaxID=2740835 RepID=A0A8X6HPH2_TRICU|nr:hypothetical protein TNCT_525251 [Trichonephila clavata]